MSAFRLFQSCTAAITRPTIIRAYPRLLLQGHSLRALAVRRHLSTTTDTIGHPTKDEPPEEKSEERSEVAAEEALISKLKSKDEEIEQLTNQLRYSQADFINLQRISSIEKEQTRDYAISRFAKDVLSTVDTLSLALSSTTPSTLSPTEPASPEDPLRKGIELTHRQLLSTLERYGVKPFNPEGEKFDPHWHEAMFEAIVPGKEEGTVIDVLKVGYKIKDRCLRAAQVGIAGKSQT